MGSGNPRPAVAWELDVMRNIYSVYDEGTRLLLCLCVTPKV